MTKPPKWHVRLTKTQISLAIRPVWSVFAVHSVEAKDQSLLNADSEDPAQTAQIGQIFRFIWVIHYENTPIQIYWKFYYQKIKKNQIKKSDISHVSAQNIDCGYLLEPPRRGGSNEYPQSMFWA